MLICGGIQYTDLAFLLPKSIELFTLTTLTFNRRITQPRDFIQCGNRWLEVLTACFSSLVVAPGGVHQQMWETKAFQLRRNPEWRPSALSTGDPTPL